MSMVRFSKQREAILNYLKSSSEHPTAEMVYDEIRQDIPNISLGTVYRNLTFLVELGEIIIIRAKNQMQRFDAKVDAHYHWQCQQCGIVEDLHMAVQIKLNEEAEKVSGVKMNSHEICFFGICKKCEKLGKFEMKKIVNNEGDN